MGVQKKTRKFAQVKRVIGQRDLRLKKNQVTGDSDAAKDKRTTGDELVRDMYVSRTTETLFQRSLRFQY